MCIVYKLQRIALGSIFSEIFDNCIISAECLALNADDLQFAYKSGCSTTQCVSVLCETIDYYVHNESDVYMCSIDAPRRLIESLYYCCLEN